MTEPRRVPFEASNISKDPRLRRTTSYHTPETTSSQINEKRDPLIAREGASGRSNAQQRSDGSAFRPSVQEIEQNDSVKSLRTLISSAVNGGLLKRKQEYFERELKAARDHYERTQRESKQFPVVIEQAEQEIKRIETSYNSTKQEADEYEVKESTVANAVLRLFVGLSANPAVETLTAEIRALKQEVETVQASQSSGRKRAEETHQALTKVSAQNNDLINRVTELDNTVKRQEEDLRVLKHTQQQVEALRKELNEQKKAQGSSKSTEQLSDFEAFRKSIQLKAKNTQDGLEAVEGKLSLLQHNVSGQDATASLVQEELSKLGVLRDEIAKLRKSDEGRSKAIASLHQDYIKQFTDLKDLRNDIADLKGEVAKSLVDHKAKSLNDLAQQVDDRIAQVSIESDRRHTNIFNEVQRIERDFRTKFENLQQDVKKVAETSIAQPTVSAASSEETTAALTQKLGVLEGHITDLQQGLEIQRHHFQSLDHRFNNLDTVKLHQRILQVVAPSLPKFEQRLVKMTEKVEKIEHKIEHPEPKPDTGVEQARKPGVVEETLTEQKTQLESLAKEFREGRDKIKEEIHEILVARMKSANDESSHRDTTKTKLKEIQVQINDLRQVISQTGGTKRGTPDSDLTGFSIKGRSQASSRLSRRTPQEQPKPEQLTALNVRSNGTLEDEVSGDELIPDEVEASALLEKFKRPTTSSSHTSREDSTGRSTTKRKRSDRDNSEEPIIAESDDEPPSRSRRRGRR
ncbi:hypothetical protein LTR10_013725 [Elasticomyces elasticus]|uniref:Uncharacterized protein n=1 Tax=Exophiala sideris TaxID=1016849 RepID=A0ABR0JIJ8_9EURO|nr:hypothetical protein LTR10_013725 [Elasticomyces elasticus]KAK5033299.1 hypothetical protein LTS07_003601 [Exophiala sideris]KAK5042203.1 hypothetical protein LTR13_002009 [Exophiala sideris]KAK5063843.1 hypothetical protein LTR69_003609 [Exophiala sideris]KAK5185471.1 hypothetical protein LTR44_002460 [Eurotiomycetes sp. CCFEE 6388]